MSGVFIHTSTGFNDNSAFKYFIENSICSLLSTYSNNAIVFKLELIPREDLIYPYGTLKLNDATKEIEIINITVIILKFIIINKYHNYLGHQGERHDYYPDLDDKYEIDPNYEKHKGYEGGIKETGKKDFINEVKKQKIVFYDSYMVDYQLKGICPDVLGILTLNTTYSLKIFEKFNIPDPIDKDIIQTFFEYCKKLRAKKYDIGCIAMEFIYGEPISSFITSDNTRLHPNYLIMKAKLLILVDKLHYIGFRHLDLHTFNIIVNNPDNPEIMEVFIIDFDKSRLISNSRIYAYVMINGGYDKKVRLVKFDTLDEIDPENISTITTYNTDGKYINNSIIRLEGIYAGMMTPFDDDIKLPIWNSMDKKVKSGDYKFVPIELMNEEYRENIYRGKIIENILLSSILGIDFSEETKMSYIEEKKEEGYKNPLVLENFSKITGANQVLIDFLEKNGYDESCIKLLTNNINCINIESILQEQEIHEEKEIDEEEEEELPPEIDPTEVTWEKDEQETLESNYDTILKYYRGDIPLPIEEGGGPTKKNITKKYKKSKTKNTNKYKNKKNKTVKNHYRKSRK
jgi:hypothetical protein